MEELTRLGESVAATKGRYDAACKRLLAERQVLARVLREWVPEFAGAPIGQIEREGFEAEPRLGEDAVGRDGPPGRARLLAGEDVTLAEGTAIFDVRVTALAPGGGRVELDVEAQDDFRPGYPLLKRAAFYAARLLSQQGDEVFPGSHYERVHKVVSAWVCSDPPQAFAGTVTSFSIRPEGLVGEAPFGAGECDYVQVLMLCLRERRPGSSPGALGMLEVLLCDGIPAGERLAILRDRYGMMVTREIEEGAGDMCNLSDGVFRRGMERGREEGREEERARYLEAAASLVRDGVLALREASERLGFSEQELRAAL